VIAVAVNVHCSCTSDYPLAASAERRFAESGLAIDTSEVW